MINVPHKHIFPLTKSGGGGGRLDLSEILTSQKKKKNEKENPFSPIFETLIEFGWGDFDKITLRSLIFNL